MESSLLAVVLLAVAAGRCHGNVVATATGGDSFFPEWGLGGGRSAQPTCVDIPRNLTLCYGIRYSKMRLPNLLDHDSMAEIIQQAASWVPLLNVRCHADTQLFLCSLFSPVCLDRPIYPCRGLCERVRQGCEGRMKTYGYPWPDMLRCDKFPLDNDMCIGPMSSPSVSSAEESDCQACEQSETYENIMDHYCRADFVMRTKVKRLRPNKISAKKSKMLKMSTQLRDEWRRNKRPSNLLMELGEDCCTQQRSASNANRFLVMGVQRNGLMVPTLVLPWTKRSKAIRSAVKLFKKFNCSDPKAAFTADSTSPAPTQPIDDGQQRRGKKFRASKKRSTTTTATATTAATAAATMTTTTPRTWKKTVSSRRGPRKGPTEKQI